MSTIYCPKCESMNADDSPVCGMCGHGLSADESASKLDRLKSQHFQLKRRIAAIKRDVFSGTHEPGASVDTIKCPKCDRKIVPQWTYTGRKYLLVVEYFALEGHGRSRFCPLCGVDVDAFIQDLLTEEKALKEKMRFEELRPADKVAHVIGMWLFGLLAVVGIGTIILIVVIVMDS